MKIGILTFHNADNYGAVLQCYALQETLKKCFHNSSVQIVDYRNSLIEDSYKAFPFAWKKAQSVLRNILRFCYWTLRYAPRKKTRNAFASFRKSFLDIGSDDFSAYDAIFYGSDQIWTASITGGDDAFFGAGFSGTKIAYAASDGGELVVSEKIKDLLSDFTEITCRESTLTNLLLQNGIDGCYTVCDPVFLLSKDEWLKIAQKPKERDYILAYKISERTDFDEQAEKLSALLGKRVIEIVYVKSLRKLFCVKKHFAAGINPAQFVGYIANADYVLTTSFHGTAFSIIFEKPFTTLAFQKRSERVLDLLQKVSLEKCFADSVPESPIESGKMTSAQKEMFAAYIAQSRQAVEAICAKIDGGGG